MIKTEAILVRKSRLTESSLIIQWCTRDFGFLRTVAKGALRPKSPFAGKLDLFYTAEIDFVRSRSSDLHTLRELAVIGHRFGIETNYPRLLAASYFVKLLELVAESETPIPELYDLLRRGLDHLRSHDPSVAAVTHFERETARCLGLDRPGPSAAIESIRQVYHAVPSQRQRLMSALDETAGNRPAGPPK
jgi:DNA repair protein RecO (recombination protein O)